jgi:hypothetical protein
MDKDQREEFMEELYARQGADQAAKQMLREHMQAAGVEWDGEV